MAFDEEGEGFSINDSLVRLMDVLLEFYKKKDIDQKARSTLWENVRYTRIEYRDEVCKTVFKTDVKLAKFVAESQKAKSVSLNGGGRSEMVTVLATQLQNILMRPQRAIDRLMGKETV